MIVFNELEIINNKLILDVSISPFHFDEGLSIEKIYLRTFDSSGKFTDLETDEKYEIWSNDEETAKKDYDRKWCETDSKGIDIDEDGNIVEDVDKQLFDDEHYTKNTNPDHVRLVQDLDEYGEFKKPKLYFVYVYTEKNEDAPCGLKSGQFIGVVYNKQILYNHLMNSIGSNGSTDECSMDLNMINQFLLVRAFEMALKAGNFKLAIDYWNRFISGVKTTAVKKSCGCGK